MSKTPQVMGGIQVRPGLIPPSVLSKERAELLAKMNQVDDEDGWVYTAVPLEGSKRNLYRVEVKDSEGNVVDYL